MTSQEITQQRINALVELGDWFRSNPEELQPIFELAQSYNGWFDAWNCKTSIKSICQQYLQPQSLIQFANSYALPVKSVKKVGLVLAGNIPLVGFHDVLCTLLSGHIALVKMSSKDNQLMKATLLKLKSLSPLFEEQIQIEERLSNYDAIIATGSDNTIRYFEQYFGNVPHFFRNNRISIAQLLGNESPTQLNNLCKDIFTHYGLGCRNVSFLFVPKDYSFKLLTDEIDAYNWVLQNTKYKNNFDYNLALHIVNKDPIIQTDCLLISESSEIHSRIGVIHYQTYSSPKEVTEFISSHSQKLQVVVGENYTPFGTAQEPKLTDFADHIDTMDFLVSIGNS